MSSSRHPRPALLAVVASLAVALGGLAGCSRGDGRTADGRLEVEAAFGPLAWLAEQVGGPDVAVHSLTRPGAEPHDLELTPKDVARIEDAGLVVHLGGFQPAVDRAVADVARDRSVDVAPAARLEPVTATIGASAGRADPEPAAGDHAEAGGLDPHAWLDPHRMEAMARLVARRLAAADPERADAYRNRAERLVAQLRALDGDLRDGLARCDRRDLVTAHAAFGYLAERYGLRQVAVAGIDPEQEPSPRALAAVAAYVRRHDVRTIYLEPLGSSAVGRTVATEAGVRTAELDPLEGPAAGRTDLGYLRTMRRNLAVLRAGQGCR